MSNKIRQLKSTDVVSACSLLDDAFGMDYITRSDLLAYISSPDKYASCVSDDKGRVIALSLCQLVEPNSTDSTILLHNNLQEVREKLSQHTKIGHQKCLLVHPDYRGQGLCRLLMTDAIWWMKAKGATIFIACVWEREDEHSRAIARLLIKNKFRRFSLAHKFWTKDSMLRRFNCPTCGYPCQCTATIYIRERTPFISDSMMREGV